MYKFTIPVFGKGVVYDSPLDQRLQQVRMPTHSHEHAWVSVPLVAAVIN